MPVTATAKLRARVRQRALGHRARDLGADRAVRGDQRRRHAEHLGLGLVRVGDEAALEPVARAGERRCRRRRSGRRCRTRPSRPARQPRRSSASARRSTGAAIVGVVLRRTSTARSRAACTARRRSRRTGCRSPAPSRCGAAAAQLEALVGPRHRARAWRRRRSGTGRRRPPGASKPAGVTSQSTSQKATISSQTIADGIGLREVRARSTVQAHQPSEARRASSTRRATASLSSGAATTKASPGPQRADRARAPGDRPLPKPSAIGVRRVARAGSASRACGRRRAAADRARARRSSRAGAGRGGAKVVERARSDRSASRAAASTRRSPAPARCGRCASTATPALRGRGGDGVAARRPAR